jgi:hypothetical protein
MSNTNRTVTNQQSQENMPGIQQRNVGGNLQYNYNLAATVANYSPDMLTKHTRGMINETQAQQQQRQLNNQSLASTNFVSPATNQFQEPNTAIQNPQPQTLRDLRREIVGNGAGVLQENNSVNENIESNKNLTDLAKRQPNQRPQPIAIDSQQINSQRHTQSVGIDSQPAGKRREPGILQMWNAGGMKNLKKFTDLILLENNNLDNPKPKK